MKPTMIIALLVLCSAPFYSLAEEESEMELLRGRLPDGRAFRTDGQGAQLVDYIAELELSVEELNRRVGGLEDEVKEKQAAIERLQKGEMGEGRLIERDLAAGLVWKEDRKEAGRETGGTAADRIICPPADCSVEMAKAHERLDLLRTDLEIEQQKRSKETAELKSMVTDLEGSLRARDQELEALRAKLAESEMQVKSLEVSLRSAEEKARQADQAGQAAAVALAPVMQMAALDTAKLAVEGAVRPEVPSFSSRKDALSQARGRAVQTVKGKILTDLNQIKSLVSSRDQLFKRYSGHRRAVSFKPASAVSSKNRGLDELIACVKSASSVYELSLLSREGGEIEAKIQDDIGLIQRMLKAG